MAFCSHCGTQVNDGARFCSKCGNVLVDDSLGSADVIQRGANNEKLENLYLLARRASKENNPKMGEQYYQQILVEDPNSWEATFYAAYYTAINHYRSDEDGSAILAIGNVINSVFDIIDNMQDSDEQLIATEEVESKALSALTAFRKNGEKEWEDTKKAIKDKEKEIRRSGGTVDYGVANEIWDEGKARYELITGAVSQAENLLERRTKNIRQIIAKRRFDEYWDEHPEERDMLELEKTIIEEQIIKLNKDITAIPGYTEMLDSQTQLEQERNYTLSSISKPKSLLLSVAQGILVIAFLALIIRTLSLLSRGRFYINSILFLVPYIVLITLFIICAMQKAKRMKPYRKQQANILSEFENKKQSINEKYTNVTNAIEAINNEITKLRNRETYIDNELTKPR